MNDSNFTLPILLIDDDAMVREVLVEYLKGYGFTNIKSLHDPKLALTYINENKNSIGLIISDWEMPGLNGLTLLKAVRNHPMRKNTKFIMITSQRSMERFKITQAAQMRVSSYIVKPFRADVLKQKIWEVMGWQDSTKVA